MKGFILVAATALAVVLSVQPAVARGPVRLGGNVAIGLPVGEFRDNVDKVGSGFDGYVTFGIPNVPLHVGGAVGYLTQGSETIGRMGIGAYVGDVVTRNKILMGHLLLGVQGGEASVRPFIDGLVGFKRFYTTTEIKIGFDVPDIDMDSNDWVMSYGLGGGLTIEVYERAADDEDGSGGYSVCVDLEARYLLGGKADYVDIDSVELVDGGILFRTTSSRTDMVTVHIGASVSF